MAMSNYVIAICYFYVIVQTNRWKKSLSHCTKERISFFCLLQTSNSDIFDKQSVIVKRVCRGGRGCKQLSFKFCIRLCWGGGERWRPRMQGKASFQEITWSDNSIIVCVMFDPHLHDRRWSFFRLLWHGGYFVVLQEMRVFDMFITLPGENFFCCFRALCFQTFTEQ